MTRVSQRLIRQLFQIGDTATTTTDKGKALENLICYIFEKIPGITITKRNPHNVFNTEEIDVAFWNEGLTAGLYFLPRIILVECKNWSSPVGSVEVAWFDRKLQDRGSLCGILVAANGITGDPIRRTDSQSILAGALREQRSIIIITRLEIERLTDTSQLVHLIKEKLCELAVTGSCLPTTPAS